MLRTKQTLPVLFSLLISAALIAGGCGEMPTSSDTASTPLVTGRVAPSAESATHEYAVTIENLTSGQPFSPGVIATHTRHTRLFEVGEPASEGIRHIAENGDPTVAAAALMHDEDVFGVLQTGAPVGPGGSLTMHLGAKANANRISLAVMLVCTNDGFVGIDSAKLPGIGESTSVHAMGYDAGTELNEETSETIVDGCGLGSDGNARTATSEDVELHPGITGSGDLDPAVHGWAEPAALITIHRIR